MLSVLSLTQWVLRSVGRPRCSLVFPLVCARGRSSAWRASSELRLRSCPCRTPVSCDRSAVLSPPVTAMAVGGFTPLFPSRPPRWAVLEAALLPRGQNKLSHVLAPTAPALGPGSSLTSGDARGPAWLGAARPVCRAPGEATCARAGPRLLFPDPPAGTLVLQDGVAGRDVPRGRGSEACADGGLRPVVSAGRGRALTRLVPVWSDRLGQDW